MEKLEKNNKYEVVLKIKFKTSRVNQEFFKRILEEKSHKVLFTKVLKLIQKIEKDEEVISVDLHGIYRAGKY